MTQEPLHQDPAHRADRPADMEDPAPEPVSVRRKAGGPTSGVTARSNTAEAWEQLRHTATQATDRINDFMNRTTGGRGERDRAVRQVTERGREEAGRGLRALAEAAGKLADLVDGRSTHPDAHPGSPRVIDQRHPETQRDARDH
ncbi:hypothetical protein E7744_01260 [Citricoccus sp. SGAir0253]|uniref:hypothetical protein n=1 Tax=Citricoccus sp. SGAir0253 TaxID=2567881 RepID=UPI0010CCF576|nr:hypothetical protein [Citricoccus sp. SGAir0253]QCU77003.1 hypothetical protein E7744_01260 [Citricoccus sp. SGAir0253]